MKSNKEIKENLSTEAELPKDSLKTIKEKALEKLAPLIFRVEGHRDGFIPLNEAIEDLKKEGYDDAIDIAFQLKDKEYSQKIKEYKKDIKNILNEIETLANQDCWDDERGNFRKEFLKKLKELRRKYDN
jgi:hypothetical protein